MNLNLIWWRRRRPCHAGDDEKAKNAFRKKYKAKAPTSAPPPVAAAASRTDALLAKARELRAGRLGEAPPATTPSPRGRDRGAAGNGASRSVAAAGAPRQRGTVLWFEAVWKSTSELCYPSRRGHGDNVASMAWGACNLMSTQVRGRQETRLRPERRARHFRAPVGRQRTAE